MGKLSVKGVNAKRAPGMYGDGDGLYVRVGPTGSKSWIFRATIHGKRRELGLGSTSLLSLAEARLKAQGFRKAVAEGSDPAAERQAAQKRAEQQAAAERMTFSEVARQVHENLSPKWSNKKHGEVWLASVTSYACPHFGARPVHTITKADVLGALESIWRTKPETARRLRRRLAAIFDWAIDKGHYQGQNPVRAITSLESVSNPPQHMLALPWRDLPDFWSELRAREGISAYCLSFIILTAARSGEARGARWSEIDREAGTWSIPGERMKGKRPHRIPLAPDAIAVLEKVRGLDPVLVFPSIQRGEGGEGRPMSDMVFKALMKRMKRGGITTHGFRSTFRDWCSESAHADREVAEAALSHTTGNAVERAYARSDLFERRRALMEAWARYVSGETGQVVQMVRG